jgi:hypothetical protein
MMLRTYFLILTLFSTIALPRAYAQETSSPSLFQQIFPQPTGQNGYEEIVAAGEMLSRSTLLAQGEQKGLNTLTLTQKRAVLADPPVSDALALFRLGLTKSLHTPRDKSHEGAYKAFSLYRRLARVLAMEQYVLCADGRTNQAIDSLQDVLRLGYSVQRDALMGGLVGIAIDSLAAAAIQRHLDQLSEKDCRRIVQLARAWQSAPDPAIEAMGVERDQSLQRLESQLPTDANFPKEQVLAGMRARFDHYAANLTKPVWERKPPLQLQGNTFVADYVNNLGQTLDPIFEQAQTVFVRDQARMQILGVHAAIRQFRWEHDALPISLEILNLGSLARDPFTGKPLQYRTTGPTTYELTSEGLQPKAASASRVPVRKTRVRRLQGSRYPTGPPLHRCRPLAAA